MSGFLDLNLIRLLDFYFMFVFVVGTVRRFGQYQSVAHMVWASPGRWPKLLDLVKEHHMIFLSWALVLPGLLTLGLAVAQLLASRSVFPEATLTAAALVEHWPYLIVMVPLAAAMVGVDLYGLIDIGTFDRKELEKYFDQAEYWLRSKTATVVRVFTFGYVNPRQMVAVEVRKALIDVSTLLASTLWWVSLQISLRIAFGLALWLTWALVG